MQNRRKKKMIKTIDIIDTVERIHRRWVRSDALHFKHGSEGTHYACAEITNSDDETTCCGCSGHKCKGENNE